MAESRVLALLHSPRSLSALPAEARVLALSPRVVVEPQRRVASTPESLLPAGTAEQIEREARDLAERWWQGRSSSQFTWESVDLATCFSYGLRFVARDLLKSAALVDKLREKEQPTELVTDAPTSVLPFPSYPYLHAIGPLLRAWARKAALRFRTLPATQFRYRKSRQPSVLRAYSALAAKSAVRRLGGNHTLAAVGAFPEFYRPVAAAWAMEQGSTAVISPSSAPIRSDAALKMFYVPVESIPDAHRRAEIREFALRTLESFPTRLPFSESDPDRLEGELQSMACLGSAFERGLEKASAVLTMETHTPFSRAAVRYARRKDVPLTVLQHGVVADPASYRETETDRVAVWGPRDAEWFERNLAPSVFVEPTGNPRYDALTSHMAPSEGRRPSSHIVTFASAPFGHLSAADSPWDRDRLQRMVLDAIDGFPDAQLIVKRHPAEAPEPLPSTNVRLSEVTGGDTLALIRSSSVVLSRGSTVALEAMYLDRPSIFLGPPVPESPFCPPEDGGGLRAVTSAELHDLLRRLFYDFDFRKGIVESQREYLKHSFAPLDGRASGRLVSFLRKTPAGRR